MAEEIGKLVVDFEADISEFKLAISEVKSLMKDMGSETRKSTADFATLAGVTAGLTNFGFNTMKNSIQGINKGLSDFLQESPDFVMAQNDLNMTFRDIAEDVGPGATRVLEAINTILSDMKGEGFFDDVSLALKLFAGMAVFAYDKLKALKELIFGEDEIDRPGPVESVGTDEGNNRVANISVDNNNNNNDGGNWLLNANGVLLAESIAEAIKDLIDKLMPFKVEEVIV